MKNFTQVPNEGIKWSRKLTAERYPKPLSPLGWSNIQAVFDEGVRAFAVFMGLPLASNAPLAISVNGWILANENAFDFKNHFKINLTKREQASLLLETISLLLGSSNPLKSLKSLVHWLKYPEKSATRLGNSLNSIVLPFAGQAIFSYLQRISNDIDQSWENTKISFQEEVAKIGNLIESEEDPPKLLILGEKLRAAMISYIKPDL
ncbi:hypothetical protein HYY75_11315, partial [bacterium]|nr:hypothetical protein [bacterium]